jgi:hypothetical protein
MPKDRIFDIQVYLCFSHLFSFVSINRFLAQGIYPQLFLLMAIIIIIILIIIAVNLCHYKGLMCIYW